MTGECPNKYSLQSGVCLIDALQQNSLKKLLINFKNEIACIQKVVKLLHSSANCKQF